jgi:hypothetical protein
MTTFDAQDFDVFLSDFATTVTAATWGKTFSAIFDDEYVEFSDTSGVQPSLMVAASEVPTTYQTGDLFTLTVPATGVSTTYRLVDIEHAEPGFKRLVLALP